MICSLHCVVYLGVQWSVGCLQSLVGYLGDFSYTQAVCTVELVLSRCSIRMQKTLGFVKLVSKTWSIIRLRELYPFCSVPRAEVCLVLRSMGGDWTWPTLRPCDLHSIIDRWLHTQVTKSNLEANLWKVGVADEPRRHGQTRGVAGNTMRGKFRTIISL